MTISKLINRLGWCYYSIPSRRCENRHSMNIINIENLSNREEAIDSAITSLLDGLVIALPTDTIYGLAGLAQNDKAIEEIYSIKQRKSEKPLAICVGNIEDVYDWGKVTVPDSLLRCLLPGPVTLIFERTEALNPCLNPDNNLVGIRIPDYPFIRDVVLKCGSPLALTSANISSEKSPLKITEFKELWDKLPKVFDGGPLGDSEQCRKGSTIIDLSTVGLYQVIRKGSAFLRLQKCCKNLV